MMEYVFAPLWAALQIGFMRLFLSAFLPTRCRREERVWIIALAWLAMTLYALFGVQGFHAYLMYLLAAVLFLLVLHGEYGPRGLCLLALTFLIPVAVDQVVVDLASGLPQWLYWLTVTGGKALPAVLVWVLRRMKLLAGAKPIQPDGDMLLLRQHMEMQQESMAALEQNYRMQRRSTHEFEHHMQVLRELLDRGEVTAARDYLERLKKNRAMHPISVSSNHAVIDAILHQKYQTARDNEIRMQLQVNDLSGVTIPADDLAVVLTNLLDNAIEACRRKEGYREILCSILADDGLYISIRNTSDPVKVVDGKIPTSKQDSLSHGFGLLSVSYVLDRLNAEYTFGYEEGWFHFAAEIEYE